ncbi:MAG: tat (twin-arginine translocation) pathway signal sequence [Candidatus Riflebacteria bacterium GWC2_50_8]|nr:MAG: tat (twin-arginine translocation) pathway signal sequence [Candidatus Riflebacteria bacterium GWC2_50_8]
MDRRSFISLVSALAATYNFKLPYRARAEELSLASGTAPAGGLPDLVAVMGGTPVEMLDRALAAAGGLGRFVKQGQKVLVKPNIGWDKTPEEGANTNPSLVKHLIELCFKAGAKEVNVFDNTCNQWQACYSNSQIETAVKEAGGTMLMAHEESYYTEIDLPRGVALKKAKVHKAWLESDVIINLPVLKHHGGARMTAAMKNLMGVVWDRRHYHRTDLHQCIADFTTIDKKPTLNIIDAYNVMMRNGPRGVSTADLATKKMLLLSTDMVAIDTAASRILEAQPDEIAYIAMAAALNTGVADLSKLKIERITI